MYCRVGAPTRTEFDDSGVLVDRRLVDIPDAYDDHHISPTQVGDRVFPYLCGGISMLVARCRVWVRA